MRRHLSLLIGSLVLFLALLIAPAANWATPSGLNRTTTVPVKPPARSSRQLPSRSKLTGGSSPIGPSRQRVQGQRQDPIRERHSEIGADGSQVPLQVGAVVMLPDGFTLAPQDRWTDEIREETEGVYFSQYSDDQPNILLVGPIPGDQHQEIVFPVLSPDPATDSSIHFGKYQIHVGGNRGRGQVYPTGEKSNNAVYTAPATGTVAAIEPGDNGSSVVTITGADGSSVAETVPVGPALLVSVGDNIEAGAALTDDPNVGGFGQVDAEVVLQNPVRIYGLLAFFAAVALAQIMLVLKKRQIEKVQAAEGI